ncbi:Uncharacterised protein [Yersinia pseudotuberculosis]|nr:Uncharacterised protein [Yersinia pseudotuberculosis]CNC02432.1 Uncharacterised protein [Yersinia pseudotuberculosis]CNC30570.1 Uncharacterised protein [Yersinia pseudotuberculosis]CRY62028.1 Uncharacterised protein [Yersinia pseudotuberculosis]
MIKSEIKVKNQFNSLVFEVIHRMVLVGFSAKAI